MVEGTAYHQGRGGGLPAAEDGDVSHEAELTGSGNLLLVTDERDGGVTPPGASCSPGVDNPEGNGGIHAYARDRLTTTLPATAEEAHTAYAMTPAGEKAIFRLPTRTQPQGSFCTAHVFQQITGENRIFMGWYSQGTAVVDFFEKPDGTLVFQDAAYFIPENANTWTSAVFKTEDNKKERTRTYYGATGDFGRASIDVWEVTLPLPPEPAVEVPPAEIGDCGLLFTGTDDADTFDGLETGDRIRGRGGPDKIDGKGGSDCLFGNKGKDKLKGGAGDDLAKGGPHADKVRGGDGDDKLHGNAGKDSVRGGDGDDSLRGGRSVDEVSGGDGDDKINVRGGGDIVTCGDGIDEVRGGAGDKIAGDCEKVILKKK